MLNCHKSASIATGVGEVKPENLLLIRNHIRIDMSAIFSIAEPKQNRPGSNDEIRTSVIRSFAEIETIREFWSRWQNHPNADIDFYLTTARSNPGFVRPHILVVHRGHTPEAILIGRIEDRPIECKVGYKTLFRPKARVMNFIYAGVLGNCSEEICGSVIESINDALRSGEADLTAFRYLKVDSPLYAKTTHAKTAPAKTRRWFSSLRHDLLAAEQAHLEFVLPRGAEEFRRVVPKNVRKSNRWNRLARDYPQKVRIEWLRAASDLDRIVDAVEEIASKTYLRGLGLGFVNDEATRRRLQLEAEKGWLRAFILYIEDRPRAYWLGTLYKGVMHGNYVGFDPACGQYSPGMFLMMSVIEQLCTNGGGEVLQIDWGLGDVSI